MRIPWGRHGGRTTKRRRRRRLLGTGAFHAFEVGFGARVVGIGPAEGFGGEGLGGLFDGLGLFGGHAWSFLGLLKADDADRGIGGVGGGDGELTSDGCLQAVGNEG